MKELVLKKRSHRRLLEDFIIDVETLKYFVNLARLTASAAHKQPLKYMLSCDRQKNASIFSHPDWAGYLKDRPGPPERNMTHWRDSVGKRHVPKRSIEEVILF